MEHKEYTQNNRNAGKSMWNTKNTQIMMNKRHRECRTDTENTEHWNRTQRMEHKEHRKFGEHMDQVDRCTGETWCMFTAFLMQGNGRIFTFPIS